MEFTTSDLDIFLSDIYEEEFSVNSGGMGTPDMFSLWFALTKLKPEVVIESGVWNGFSTKLIRKTVGSDCKIFCLDPRDVAPSGYRDTNPNTVYFTGNKFTDFNDLPLSNKWSLDKVFVFFDCHQDACMRLLQSEKKGLKHIFFNDNYPVGCGSHYTIEHLRGGDNRKNKLPLNERDRILRLIQTYHVFPNIYSGKIKTGEGEFDCDSLFPVGSKLNPKYDVFYRDLQRYRWNTYICLK